MASAVVGASSTPMALSLPPDGIVKYDQDSDAKTVSEHPMQAVGMRREYLEAYDGAKTSMTPEIMALMRKSRFRNYCFDGNVAADEFIQERTK